MRCGLIDEASGAAGYRRLNAPFSTMRRADTRADERRRTNAGDWTCVGVAGRAHARVTAARSTGRRRLVGRRRDIQGRPPFEY